MMQLVEIDIACNNLAIGRNKEVAGDTLNAIQHSGRIAIFIGLIKSVCPQNLVHREEFTPTLGIAVKRYTQNLKALQSILLI